MDKSPRLLEIEGAVMPMTKQQIENEIDRLPLDDQVSIAEGIMTRAVPMDSEIQRAWAAEGERRLDELLSGKVKGIPAEEVFAKLRRRNEKKN